jgi:hypothetical protein
MKLGIVAVRARDESEEMGFETLEIPSRRLRLSDSRCGPVQHNIFLDFEVHLAYILAR